MKIVLLTASLLLPLAACQRSPEATGVETNAAMLEDSLQQRAAALEALADNTSNQAAAEAIEDATDNLEAVASNVRDTARMTVDNLQ